MLDRRPPAAGREHQRIVVQTDILRVDDLVGLDVLENAVLMNSG